MTLRSEAAIYARQHKLYEKRIRPLFLRALKAQIQPVIDWMEANPDITPPIEVIVPIDVFRVPFKQAYRMVGITAAKREYYRIKGTEEKGVIEFLTAKWEKLFEEYAMQYAYRIENKLAETTRESIREAIRQAQELKLSAGQTITLIKKYAQGEISRFRASMISRTESTTISNIAKEVGAREWLSESGQEGYKEYIGRNDARERNTHRALNGVIIPIDDLFDFGTHKAKLPGDPTLPAEERIQCRCSVIYLTARVAERIMRERNNN